MLVPWSKLYVYWSPTSKEVAGHHMIMGSREETFCFPLILHTALAFASLHCLYLDPWRVFSFYFFPHCPVEEVSDRAVWWVLGIFQPGSTYHNSQKINKAGEGKFFFIYFPCLSLDPFLPHHQTNTSSDPSIQKHNRYIPRGGSSYGTLIVTRIKKTFLLRTSEGLRIRSSLPTSWNVLYFIWPSKYFPAGNDHFINSSSL